ncbi:hypothetical protein BJX64DRAFT_264922 [Aspergillus heterothallicus]
MSSILPGCVTPITSDISRFGLSLHFSTCSLRPIVSFLPLHLILKQAFKDHSQSIERSHVLLLQA